MRYCKACNIYLTGTIARCPLCQSRLSGEATEDSYPHLPVKQKPYGLLIRMIALMTIIAIVVCGVINLSLPGNRLWFLPVAAGLASAWLSVGMILRRRRNPMKAAIWQLVLVSILVLLWDWFTGGNGWSIHFVLPVFFPCMQLAVAVTARALHLRPSDYLLYLILCVLAGLIPMILLLCGALRIIYPSVICAGISIISLAAMLLFKGSALRSELIRRLHL